MGQMHAARWIYSWMDYYFIFGLGKEEVHSVFDGHSLKWQALALSFFEDGDVIYGYE